MCGYEINNFNNLRWNKVYYVTAEQGIHFMTDWWVVFELNYEEAPNLWGRDVEDLIRQQHT